MWFAVHLLRKRMITAEQFAEAVERQLADRVPIGKLAVEFGKLSVTESCEILDSQIKESRFWGRIAVERGYLTEQELGDLLMAQAERVTPLIDILVEIGAIGVNEVSHELKAARRAMVLHEEMLIESDVCLTATT